MRVLIADDNRLMLEGFRRALEPVEDIEVVGATHTGAQVLPLVERRRPEIVALELGMRGEGGVSCLELLRDRHPDVKVVVLSASSSHDHIRWALTHGARAYIVKSVDPLDIPPRCGTPTTRPSITRSVSSPDPRTDSAPAA